MAVLIVVTADNAVDYWTDNKTLKVAFVDFRAFRPAEMFPDDVDRIISRVAGLPLGFPQRSNTVKELVGIRDAVRADIYSGDPYRKRN